MLNVGDTIEGYIRDPAVLEAQANAQWDEIGSIVRPYRQLPLYYTPGNHDIWTDVAEQIYRDRTGQGTHYAFTYQSSLYVILDNSRGRELSEEMYTYLEAQLKANQDKDPKFITFHQPFWLGYVAAGDATARLHTICKQYGSTGSRPVTVTRWSIIRSTGLTTSKSHRGGGIGLHP